MPIPLHRSSMAVPGAGDTLRVLLGRAVNIMWNKQNKYTRIYLRLFMVKSVFVTNIILDPWKVGRQSSSERAAVGKQVLGTLGKPLQSHLHITNKLVKTRLLHERTTFFIQMSKEVFGAVVGLGNHLVRELPCHIAWWDYVAIAVVHILLAKMAFNYGLGAQA